MTNVKDFFSGNFLKAENCKGGELCEILAIGEISEIKTPEGKMKAVLNYTISFDGVEKTFTPNQTNGNILIDAFGEDDKNWIGKKFTITLVKVPMFGKMKDSIVISPQIPVKAGVPAPIVPKK